MKVFNDYSQLKQWSHEFLLLISFFWQNLTSRFLPIEYQYRNDFPEIFFWVVFCECTVNLLGKTSARCGSIVLSLWITLLHGCSSVAFALHLRNTVFEDYCLWMTFLSKLLLLVTQSLQLYYDTDLDTSDSDSHNVSIGNLLIIFW